MAICKACKNDMLAVESCSGTHIKFPDGKVLPVSTEHFGENSGRCHDCNIIHGGSHHPGCDAERCPRCNGQLITCGCLDETEYALKKDGKGSFKGTYNECLVKLQKSASYSWHHAMKYEGWTIEEVKKDGGND